jgi:hypothetical protein
VQEGRGLGKSGQGIAQALQVEKTSRRGGRILKGEPTILFYKLLIYVKKSIIFFCFVNPVPHNFGNLDPHPHQIKIRIRINLEPKCMEYESTLALFFKVRAFICKLGSGSGAASG